MSFIWKDKSSDSMDVVVLKMPVISRATEDYDKEPVPGSDETLTIKNGLVPVTKPVTGHYCGSDINGFMEWLSGKGNLILGNQEDRYYEAEILDKVEITELVPSQLYKFSCEFFCQPLGYHLGSNCIEITSTATVYNPGNYKSSPYMKITGAGNITLTINGRNTVFKGVTDFIEVDSKLKNAYRTVNGGKSDANNLMYSPFPYLDSGENAISWTGTVSKVEILPRWCSR